MDACLADAYGTILDAESGARRRELPVLAGVAADDWLDAYFRLEPPLNAGELSRTRAYELIPRANGVKPLGMTGVQILRGQGAPGRGTTVVRSLLEVEALL